MDTKWKVDMGALPIGMRIYVLEALSNPVISVFHDHSDSGYIGGLMYAKLLFWYFDWWGLDTTVCKYVTDRKQCPQINTPHPKWYEVIVPLPALFNPWDGITMDLVTDQPASTKSEYTRIPVIVNQLSKMSM